MIVIGKVGAPYGIKGFSKLVSYADPPENIIDYTLYTKDREQNFVDLKYEIVILHTNAFIINLRDCKDRDQAGKFTNTLLYIDNKELTKKSPKEFFWYELHGLTVYDSNNNKIGVISKIIETGSHDVLIIDGSKIYSVPFIQDLAIIKIDLNNKTIIIDMDYAVAN